MPQDDEFDGRLPMQMQVGRLMGLVDANHKTFENHVVWSRDEFRSLKDRLDGVHLKLDTIMQVQASQQGGRAALKFVMQPAFWLVTAGVSMAAWVFSHFALKGHI